MDTSALVWVAGSVIAAIGFWVLLVRRRHGSGPSGDVGSYMMKRAQQAIERAKTEFGIVLDGTPESVQHVESILSTLHERHVSKPIGNARLAEEANVWGAYIGEAAKRVRQGTWQRDSRVAGRGAAPLVHDNGDEVYPLAWTHRRIKDGFEENVWVKFQQGYMANRFQRVDISALVAQAQDSKDDTTA